MLRYAAKSYSIGKRIQGEDERESNYYQQKESSLKTTELREEIEESFILIATKSLLLLFASFKFIFVITLSSCKNCSDNLNASNISTPQSLYRIL
jgi:hypothetical protein